MTYANPFKVTARRC